MAAMTGGDDGIVLASERCVAAKGQHPNANPQVIDRICTLLRGHFQTPLLYPLLNSAIMSLATKTQSQKIFEKLKSAPANKVSKDKTLPLTPSVLAVRAFIGGPLSR